MKSNGFKIDLKRLFFVTGLLLIVILDASCSGHTPQNHQIELKVLAHSYVDGWFELSILDFQLGSKIELTNRSMITPTSFSFDNKRCRIIFSAYAEDGEELFLMPLEVGGWRVLTRGGNQYSNPSWSPDGKYITFDSRLTDNSYEVLLSDENVNIISKLILSKEVNARSSVWSPNGDYIAVLIISPDVDNDREAAGIGIVDYKSGELIQEVSGYTDVFRALPAWSPDGSKLIYAMYNEGSLDLYLINIESGGRNEIASTEANEWYAVWSPGGSSIAYLRSDKENRSLSNLILLDLEEGEQEILIEEKLPINALIWVDETSIFINAYYKVEDKTIFYLLNLEQNSLQEIGACQGMYFQPVMIP